MSPDVISALLTGAGVAGAWVLAFLTGWVAPGWAIRDKDRQIADLKAALQAQTNRADVAVEAAHTMNLILAGLRREAGREVES